MSKDSIYPCMLESTVGNWPIIVLTWACQICIWVVVGGAGLGRKPPLTLQLHLLLFSSPKVFEKTGPNVSCGNTHFLVQRVKLKLIPLENIF